MFILDLLGSLVGLIYPLLCFLSPSCVEYYQTVGYYMQTIQNDTALAFTYPQTENSHSFIPTTEGCSVYGTFDYIVVGGGSTGAVIAGRLSENSSISVLLVEAGGAESDFNGIPSYGAYNLGLQLSWNYITTPQQNSCLGMDNQQCGIFKGRGLGGSSLLTMSMYERGNRQDYDKWCSQGNPSWCYNNTLPFFLKSERSEINGTAGYHGANGSLNVEYPNSASYSPQYYAFIAANKELGVPNLDYNGPNQLGASPTQFTTMNGIRESTAKVFLTPTANRKNINVTIGSYATQILIDPVAKTAYGVKFSKQGGCFVATARKEVVVSAGAIGSPQLLLQSGVGPESDLNQLGIPVVQNLSVGRNFQNYPAYYNLVFQTNYTVPNESLQSNVEDFLNNAGSLIIPGNQQGVRFVQTNTTGSPGLPDVQLIMVPSRNNVDNSVRKKAFHYTDETYNAVWANVDQTSCFVLYIVGLHPKSRGFVKLNSTNPYDYPLINPRILSDSEDSDIETLYRAIQVVLSLVNTSAFGQLNATLLQTTPPACLDKVYLTREYWYCCLRQLAMPINGIGTCKMGPDPLQGAVVNNEAKVHGIGNLRVADASIFPECVSADDVTTASIMIGEVVSNMIKNPQ